MRNIGRHLGRALGICVLLTGIAIEGVSLSYDTLVSVSLGTVKTLDPIYAWDTTSRAILLSVYQGLIRTTLSDYATGTRASYPWEFWRGSTMQFSPVLAEIVPTKENGNISADGKRYFFQVRRGVKFHETGHELTAEDVAYSYQRALLQGEESIVLADALGVDCEKCEEVMRAVRAEGQYVIFTLKEPRSDFLAILAQDGYAFNHMVEKAWVAANGGWPGTCDNWAEWSTKEAKDSPLHTKANGTGPFKVKEWIPGQKIVLVRNEDYKPLPKIREYVRYEIICPVQRTQMILEGTADLALVPFDLLPQVEGRDELAVIGVNVPDLPVVSMYPVILFNPSIAEDTPYIPSSYRRVCEDGMPLDFFADINVRKAFAYAFQYDAFWRALFKAVTGRELSEIPAVSSRDCGATGPIPRLLEPFFNPEQGAYCWDLRKARDLLQQSRYGKELWETGFTLVVPYREGHVYQKVVAEVLKKSIEWLHPDGKFHVELRPIAPREWRYYSRTSLKTFPFRYADGWVVPPTLTSSWNPSCTAMNLSSCHWDGVTRSPTWRRMNTTLSSRRGSRRQTKVCGLRSTTSFSERRSRTSCTSSLIRTKCSARNQLQWRMLFGRASATCRGILFSASSTSTTAPTRSDVPLGRIEVQVDYEFPATSGRSERQGCCMVEVRLL